MARIQTLFCKAFNTYRQSHKLPLHYIKAAYAFMVCRTVALGGHKKVCVNGHIEGIWYNSCKHRMCPQCNGLAKARWLEKQKATLLNCAHRHIIFTIPHEFHALWRFNNAQMTDLLFKATRDTIMSLCADPQHLGGVPGFLCALHTWGRSLSLHPHIHGLITEGGVDPTGTWRTPKRACFLPAKVVMVLFRGKFLAYLKVAVKRGKITLPPDTSETRVYNLINKLGRKKKWNVNIRERYPYGEGLATYLARYVRGGPLHNGQLHNLTDSHVTFRYYSHRDNGDGKKRISTDLTLTHNELIERLLWHIPTPGKHVVRSFGIYSSRQLATLNTLRKHFKQVPVEAPPVLSWESYYKKVTGEEAPTRCRQCGALLLQGLAIKREPFIRGCDPPKP